jgi:hypothetical protein
LIFRSVGIPARVVGTPDWVNWQAHQEATRGTQTAMAVNWEAHQQVMRVQIAAIADAVFESDAASDTDGKRIQTDVDVGHGHGNAGHGYGNAGPSAIEDGLNDKDDDEEDMHNHNW